MSLKAFKLLMPCADAAVISIRDSSTVRGLPTFAGFREVLPLDMPADTTYAQLRWALEQSGRPIGPNDMLIAAQALAHECVLVTANMGEFSRITDLQVTDWLTVLDEPPPDTSPTTSTG